MSHGLVTEAGATEPEEPPLFPEEEQTCHECIGAWRDRHSDAEECNVCEIAIEDNYNKRNGTQMNLKKNPSNPIYGKNSRKRDG
jgi:hypothetical protein